ncbi:tetratricopeptide repeat protein [Streptomyces apocyni]|uniref:tetratricopeptide repeat protein n=1 Tax=Streptomyces apocyni TaxID=2654677 RepID=UPI0012EA77C3|nr:tetratricopeptide repeat protein [Streptomyces apocyni]
MDPGLTNHISGGVFLSTVIQGGIVNVTLPPEITPALSGLPAPASAFTGREADVERLLQGLAPGAGRRPAAPVTAVAGLGGVGKTELVVQAASRALARPGWFPGGVLFVDLFGYDRERRVPPDLALDGFLRALGLPAVHIPTQLQDRVRLYRSVLAAFAEQGRRVLVVIDNASSAGQAGPLLPADGTTAALVTSRDALDLDARRHTVRALDQAASVALLDQAIRAGRDIGDISDTGDTGDIDDTRIADSPADADAIAGLCAGLPLALRIVAALLADFPARPLSSVREALESTDDRLDLLGSRDTAVRAAFDLSYQRLDPDHARTFRLLSLNPGPDLSTEAAACLVDQSRLRTELLLQDLARAHLIETGPLWGRWQLHDLVRLHADEHGRACAATDGREDARERLYAYYLTGARAADRYFEVPPPPVQSTDRFPERGAALSWLGGEQRNLVAVVLAAAAAAAAADTPRTAAALTLHITHYLYERRDFASMLAVAETTLPVCAGLRDPTVAARTLNIQGTALRGLGRYEEAADAHRQAAAEHRELGNDSLEAGALSNLGVVLQHLGRSAEAIDVHRRALTLLETAGPLRDEAVVRNNLGTALQAQRHFHQAADEHRRAAALLSGLGDPFGEADSLNNLGATLCGLGSHREAVDAFRKALAAGQGREDPDAEATVLYNLGEALRAVGGFGEAADHLRRAVGIQRERGDRRGEADALTLLGTVLRDAERPSEAADAFRLAVAVLAALGDRTEQAGTLLDLGGVLHDASRSEEAVEAFTRSATIFRELGDRRNEASADYNTGHALQALGRLPEASDAYSRAATTFHELGDPQEASAVNALADTLLKAGLVERALTLRQQALAICEKHGDRLWAASVLAKLALDLRQAQRYEEALQVHDLAISGFWQTGAPHDSYLATVARDETARLYEESLARRGRFWRRK